MKQTSLNLTLNVGDLVWVKLPMNATITKKSKYGYVLTTDDGTIWEFFDDSDVSKVVESEGTD